MNKSRFITMSLAITIICSLRVMVLAADAPDQCVHDLRAFLNKKQFENIELTEIEPGTTANLPVLAGTQKWRLIGWVSANGALADLAQFLFERDMYNVVLLQVEERRDDVETAVSTNAELIGGAVRHYSYTGVSQFVFTVTHDMVLESGVFRPDESTQLPTSMKDIVSAARSVLTGILGDKEVDNWQLEQLSIRRCGRIDLWYYLVTYTPLNSETHAHGIREHINVPVLIGGKAVYPDQHGQK